VTTATAAWRAALALLVEANHPDAERVRTRLGVRVGHPVGNQNGKR
jgi:hypothetical protein